MANGRYSTRKAKSTRDPGAFVALPWTVLDSHAYARLSHPARSLLMEIARQYVRDNNGRLLASAAYLLKRGWKRTDVITRAKRELLKEGFIHETVKGHRPNKASWYAITWYSLDRLTGYDYGAAESFERGAYRNAGPLKITSFRPLHGVKTPSIAPSHGLGELSPTPSHGHHLDIPSIELKNAANSAHF